MDKLEGISVGIFEIRSVKASQNKRENLPLCLDLKLYSDNQSQEDIRNTAGEVSQVG
jgi:hypothetical protein